ncbi:MAG: hypothetical protein O6768_06955, partial [Planctomycetota bacterium]|nr:hypothetical protein [Planctomycetota bacterium]
RGRDVALLVRVRHVAVSRCSSDPPGDVDPPCEGCTSPNFALADIAGPGSPPNNPPDGCVDAFDLGKLLAEWCSVAGGNPCGTCGP